MAADWRAVRAEFPALERWTHLNSATFGQLPRCAVDAAARHFAHRDELACADFLEWFDEVDRVRETVARLIGCEAGDIGFVTNASAGLAIFLNGIDWRKGDRVVTLAGEFPNNLYGAASLAGLGVEAVETTWDRIAESIDKPTRAVLLSTVNYTTGFRPPVEEIAGTLSERGVHLYVDGTQSVGALRVDLDAMQPAMLCIDGYKWLLSPNGAGFIYVPKDVRHWLRPNATGWRSDRRWRNVGDLHHGAPELAEGSERYEAGMLPFALLFAMEASVKLMLEIGVDEIERRVLQLAAMTRTVLQSAGGDVNVQGTQIVAARFPGRDVGAISAQLRERRVLVAARHGYLRVSPHFYNDESDVDRLEAALRAVL